LFFSATMPPEIQRLVDTFLRDPARIEVARPATTANTITQLFRYCPSTEDWQKREVLRELIRAENVKNAIIFCNRKRDVAILLKSLQKHAFNAGALHGDMDQMSRTATLDAFREGRIQFLAASDVAARGLDIPDVSHILNFDVPWQSDDYVHRIGRTGRAGKEGRSLTIVTPDDIRQLKDIEKMLGAAVTWIGPAPSAEDLASGSKRRRGRRPQGKRPGAPAAEAHGARRHGTPGRTRNGSARDHEPSAQPAAKASTYAAGNRPPRRGEPESGKAPRGERTQQMRGERRPNGQSHANHRAENKAREPWEPRPPRPQRYREDRTPSPVGLGDHVPAFLKKAARPTPR
jgi:superfamily II DNA/RNA helicase